MVCQPSLAASSFMLFVWARRHGLFISVCAKPALYVAFCFSGGGPSASAPVASTPARTAVVTSAIRRVMDAIDSLLGVPWRVCFRPRALLIKVLLILSVKKKNILI